VFYIPALIEKVKLIVNMKSDTRSKRARLEASRRDKIQEKYTLELKQKLKLQKILNKGLNKFRC